MNHRAGSIQRSFGRDHHIDQIRLAIRTRGFVFVGVQGRLDFIRKFPVGDDVLADWNFSDEVQATLNPEEDEAARPDSEPNLVDVVTAAKASLDAKTPVIHDTPATNRLKLTDAMLPEIMELFQLRLDSLASAVR